MHELKDQPRLEIDSRDYIRLTRSLVIIDKLREIVGDPPNVERLHDNLILLSVSKLVDLLSINLNRITRRTNVTLPELEIARNYGCMLQATMPKVNLPTNNIGLHQILHSILGEGRQVISRVVSSSTPKVEPPAPAELLPSQRRPEEPYRTIFKRALLKNVTGRKFQQSTLATICNLHCPGRAAQRAEIDLSFRQMKLEDRQSLHGRIRNSDPSRHDSGLGELYYYNLFSKYNWRIEKEAVISGRRPDYFVSTDGGQFACEIFNIYDSEAAIAQRKRFVDFLEELNYLQPEFLLRIEVSNFPTNIDADTLLAALSDWLSTLPADRDSEFVLKLDDFGIAGEIGASFADDIHCPFGTVYKWSLHDEDAVHRYMKRMMTRAREKAIRYRGIVRESIPFLLATCLPENYPIDKIGLYEKLYGDCDIVLRRGSSPEIALHGTDGGLFVPQRRRYVSGLLLQSSWWDGSQHLQQVQLFDNPWASLPIPQGLFADLPRLISVAGGSQDLRMKWQRVKS